MKNKPFFTQTYADESSRCSLVNKIQFAVPFQRFEHTVSLYVGGFKFFFFFLKRYPLFHLLSVRAFKLDICKNMART